MEHEVATPLWKQYEWVVTLLYHDELNEVGSTRVSYNQHRVGCLSGRRRQVDVLLQEPDGTFSVVECKKHGRRVGIDTVEAFLGMVEDVGAARGLMVAPDFTKGAKRRVAARDDIELVVLDWQNACASGQSYSRTAYCPKCPSVPVLSGQVPPLIIWDYLDGMMDADFLFAQYWQGYCIKCQTEFIYCQSCGGLLEVKGEDVVCEECDITYDAALASIIDK
ncbi:MAG: restriction endonuclease [Actinomycetia bacterium]|nr:restriction endonuclease [Actinomycetes bacterium]